jgi:hypothetical protein
VAPAAEPHGHPDKEQDHEIFGSRLRTSA